MQPNATSRLHAVLVGALYLVGATATDAAALWTAGLRLHDPLFWLHIIGAEAIVLRTYIDRTVARIGPGDAQGETPAGVSPDGVYRPPVVAATITASGDRPILFADSESLADIPLDAPPSPPSVPSVPQSPVDPVVAARVAALKRELSLLEGEPKP